MYFEVIQHVSTSAMLGKVKMDFLGIFRSKELALDPAKVNPNGSGISLGHPIGATGALITVKALYELQRVGGRYALVTMCIGGGQGIAAIFERL